MDIFELLNEPLKLKPPIRMFEAFSGIGTQAMALKRLGVDYEIVGFSEIDKYAIKSYLAIHGDVKNYGDITQMQEIPLCDIFTWSFPCTDLSKAGKRQGMTQDTRSGLVYDVLRLVRDTKDKPKVLIMENVPDLIQATFVRQFGEIQAELERYGYMNYVETLNAKDYGIAQNRNRVFMVSILGSYYYKFPKPIPLTTRLKDYLEQDVDEKYFLSQEMFNYLNTDHEKHKRKHKFEKNIRDGVSDGQDYANTITTRESSVVDSTFIKIPEDTKQGYAVARDGNGVYINRPEQKRGVVQNGMIQTIKANNTDIGVVVLKETYSERSMKDIQQNIISENDIARTLTAQHQRPTINGANVVAIAVVVDEPKISYALGSREHEARGWLDLAPTLCARDYKDPKVVKHNLRIRKLTPRECWRLMGCSDEDFDKAQAVCSNSQLYKQAGNAIVVDTFQAILKNMI